MWWHVRSVHVLMCSAHVAKSTDCAGPKKSRDAKRSPLSLRLQHVGWKVQAGHVFAVMSARYALVP
jgi:hypothetical protein